MRNKLRFLKVDLLIQRLFGIILLISGISGFLFPPLFMIALLTLLVLGGWQMLSATITAIMLKNRKHVNYLLFVITYLAILGAASFFFSQFNVDSAIIGGLFILGFIVLPIAIAAWYYNQTTQMLTENNYEALYSSYEIDTILDSGELVEN